LDDFVKNNILLGDAGYDSNQLKDKVISSNIGKLLTAKNKYKLASLKLSPDKYSYNYNMFLHLACINLILNRTNLE
jgi:hypothetical protein